ncbi:ABC transporter ATP-binding protein [Mumia sp. zg.B53]|nr:ABC transporter ATP-binding protein [Mumia sp. zg.B17]MBW9214943.1 ABC transporter ATP-binding protein [Mumia sp. zg.B53]
MASPDVDHQAAVLHDGERGSHLLAGVHASGELIDQRLETVVVRAVDLGHAGSWSRGRERLSARSPSHSGRRLSSVDGVAGRLGSRWQTDAVSRKSKKTPPPLVSVDDLQHAYGHRVVFDHVTFHVRAGRCLVLRGPNGSGKTTLLRCLVGDPPTSGTVSYDGRRVDESDPRFRADVATVLGDLDFFPDLTVLEHLDLLARAHGQPPDRAEAVLEAVGIAAVRDQFPGTLSSGQRQRLALATAFVRPYRLLVLDEPEQRLDTDGQEWLANRLLDDKRGGAAIVMATHDPDLAAAVGDDVLELGA